MFYSKTTGGFYITAVHGTNIPADAVPITSEQHQALIDGQSAGKVIAADANGFPVLQDPPPPPPADPKWVGVEFEGVMCSATRDDQNGLTSVLVVYQLEGAAFQPTRFGFANGNSLTLTKDNLMSFLQVWKPFRQSFFTPET